MSVPDTNKPSGTDWSKVDALTDDQIDLSESPELADEWFARAKLIAPQGSGDVRVSVDVDQKTAAWYARQGQDRDKMIRAALRIYADAHANG